MDSDPPENPNIKLIEMVNPITGDVELTKHYYVTYRAVPGAIELTKTNKKSNQPLGGAKFEIWSADHSTKLTDTVYPTDENGVIAPFERTGELGEVLTDEYIAKLPAADENGVINSEDGLLFEPQVSDDDTLQPVEIALKEVSTPEGFISPEDPWTAVTIEPRTTQELVAPPVTVKVANVPEAELIEITGMKKWVGEADSRPTIELQQYRAVGDEDPEAVDDPVELENGTTEYTWKDLPETDKAGEQITYSVDEVNAPEGYTKEISDDGLTVTNTLKDEQTSPPASTAPASTHQRALLRQRRHRRLLPLESPHRSKHRQP